MSTARARYIIRSLLAAALAGLGVAGTIWIDNPYIKIASAVVIALAGYLGIGAASSNVEPFVGVRKADPNNPVVPNKLSG